MKVQLLNSPSGPGCRHVLVTIDGAVVDTFMRDDFGSDDEEGDPPVRRRIKFLVKQYLRKHPNATAEQIAQFIEGEEL